MFNIRRIEIIFSVTEIVSVSAPVADEVQVIEHFVNIRNDIAVRDLLPKHEFWREFAVVNEEILGVNDLVIELITVLVGVRRIFRSDRKCSDDLYDFGGKFKRFAALWINFHSVGKLACVRFAERAALIWHIHKEDKGSVDRRRRRKPTLYRYLLPV